MSREKFGMLMAALVFAAGVVMAQETSTKAQQPPNAEPQDAQTKTADNGVPKLEITPPVWDFGEKWTGEKAESTFTIKNTGTAVLHINQVKSSCGCTVAQAKKKELAPGESEEIRVTYNTKKHAENVSQSIRIMTDDPDSQTTVFKVQGHVKPLIKIEGGSGLNLGNLGLNDAVTKSIELECLYTQPLALKLKESTPSKFFDIQLETVEEGKRYRLTATTQPPLVEGSLNESAVLITGLEQMPEYPVRVWGIAQGPVMVSPKVLYVMTGQDKPTTKTLRVISRRETPLKITSIKADVDSIQAEVSPEPAEAPDKRTGGVSTTLIQVKLPAISELPDNDVMLRITLDDPDVKELTVPIRKTAGKPPRVTSEKPPVLRPRPTITNSDQKEK